MDRGGALEWISSYLSGRSQAVYIDGFMSTALPLSSGVPQGSILGTLLYVVYTNELPEIIHDHEVENGSIFSTDCKHCGTVCCYADDSTVSLFGQDTQELTRALSEKYEVISDFMASNKLKLNSEKTHLMLFSSDRVWRAALDDSVQLHTGSEIIKVEKSEKILGGVVHRNLKWTEHLLHGQDAVIKNLSKRLSAIKMVCSIADFKTRKMLTNGLFMSKLAYLMPLWGGCQKFAINTLQVMQNKAARYVTRANIYTATESLLSQCGWLSVYQMIFFHTVVLFYKTRQSKVPSVLFNMASSDYAYSTRERSKGNYKVLSKVRIPSALAGQSFRWRSVEMWNRLPSEIKSKKNLSQFKKSLKLWIIQNININP